MADYDVQYDRGSVIGRRRELAPHDPRGATTRRRKPTTRPPGTPNAAAAAKRTPTISEYHLRTGEPTRDSTVLPRLKPILDSPTESGQSTIAVTDLISLRYVHKVAFNELAIRGSRK